jgi:CAAX prenyl protease-like protein
LFAVSARKELINLMSVLFARKRPPRPKPVPLRPGGWRWWLRGGAAAIALWLWANMSGWLPLPGLDALTGWVRSWGPQHYWLLHALWYWYGAAWTLAALGLLTLTDGPRATGLRPRLSWDEHLRVSGRVLGVPCFAAYAASMAVWPVLIVWPHLWSLTGDLPFNMPAAPAWFTVSTTITDAIFEEGVLLGVFYRLLEYLPVHRKRLAYTYSAWGTLILAAARAEYHSYQGIALIWAVAPLALLITQYYRGYRALVPVIAAHALYDQWMTFKDGTGGVTSFLLACAFVMIALWAWTEGLAGRSRPPSKRLRKTLAARRRASPETAEHTSA